MLEFFQIPVAVLDQLIPSFKQQGIKKAVLKVDIEGSEARAILGGKHFLKQIDVPFIQMDFEAIRTQLEKGETKEKNLVNQFLKFMENNRYIASPMNKSWKKNTLDFKNVKRWPNDILWHKKLLI